MARLIKEHKGDIVIYTGAGISTSASIPDYRGTNGLWTMQTSRGKISNGKSSLKSSKSRKTTPLKLRLPEATTAKPTFTHMAIKVLVDEGYVRNRDFIYILRSFYKRTLKYFCEVRHVVSQNVDGLHMRSGLKREKLSELHGNLFIEQCIACSHSVFRSFDVAETTSRSHHFTGRICPRCRSLHPFESSIASNVLRQAAEQFATSKYKTNVSIENLMLSYRHAARKLAKSFESIRRKAMQQRLNGIQNSSVVSNSEILTKAPLLRDVVVHFFERQPEMGLAEIYRIQSAIEAVHGRKSLKDAVTSTSKDCKLLNRGCKRPNDESTKYLIGSPWFKRMRPAMKTECEGISKSTGANDTPSLSSDPLETPAKLIIVIGSSLTVLRNYSFLWPYGLGRCDQKGSCKKLQRKPTPSNQEAESTPSSNPIENCRLVIINLQPTCKDGVADLVLRVPCDELFRAVMLDHLEIDVPQYDSKTDPLYSIAVSLSPEEECTRTRPDISFNSI
ncbi:unnamed protein product [Trichobilharzia regenti]|nr:unnamed protein product [Trichobilharzia regenti]